MDDFTGRLKVQGSLTPDEYICKQWTFEPEKIHDKPDPPNAGIKHLMTNMKNIFFDRISTTY